MASPLLIIGQGLAGSWLGWECERAGIPFRLIDRGHATAASRVAGGLLSPLTGRRLVPAWRIAEWRTPVLAAYAELERELGVPLVTPLRIRRLYVGDERTRWAGRLSDPAVAPWISQHDQAGLWLSGGLRIDAAALIMHLRQRWLARGWLQEGEKPGDSIRVISSGADPIVIWCTGAAAAPDFTWVPWERAQGEVLRGTLAGLEPGVVRHDGRWLLPVEDGRAVVGATFAREFTGLQPTAAAQAELAAAARRLSGHELQVESHEVGVRVTTPDRRPVLGWHPALAGRGIFAGLGAKGVLWGPMLARQWVEHLRVGRAFDPETDVARYWR